MRVKITHQIILKGNKHTDSILRPTSRIHKIGKHESSILMRLGSRWYRNHNDKPAYQRGSQRYLCDPRQRFGVAVPYKSEAIDEEVSDVDVPGLNHAIGPSAPILSPEAREERTNLDEIADSNPQPHLLWPELPKQR